MLKGSNNHAVTIPGLNFEVFSSNSTYDTPQMFMNAFKARFSVNAAAGIAPYVFPCSN